MVVIVLIAGTLAAAKAIRGGGPPATEDEPVPSKRFAPSGLIATKAERRLQRQWDALPKP